MAAYFTLVVMFVCLIRNSCCVFTWTIQMWIVGESPTCASFIDNVSFYLPKTLQNHMFWYILVELTQETTGPGKTGSWNTCLLADSATLYEVHPHPPFPQILSLGNYSSNVAHIHLDGFGKYVPTYRADSSLVHYITPQVQCSDSHPTLHIAGSGYIFTQHVSTNVGSMTRSQL